MRKNQLWAGIASPIIALSGIAVAIIINRSWWSLTDNAISDLGKVGLPHSWVMNVPLLISAILAIYYALGLLKEMKNPVSKLGVLVFILGLFFLAGIAIFPEGTGPHYEVSWGFFLAGSIGFLIAGVGIGFEGDKKFGIFTVIVFTIEAVLTKWAFNTFRGVAIAEFIGILTIAIWHYTLLWNMFFK